MDCLPGHRGRCQNSSADPPSGQVVAGAATLDVGAHQPLVSVYGAAPPTTPCLSSAPTTAVPVPAAAVPMSDTSVPMSSDGDTLIDAAFHSLDAILRVRLPTLCQVPKAARDDWVRLGGDVLSSATSSFSDMSFWCKLFMCAWCIVASPRRGGRSHWRGTLKGVRARIQKWRDGKQLELWADVVVMDRKVRLRHFCSKSKGTSPESLLHSNVNRARQAVEDGQFRKALQSLASAGIAQDTEDVIKEMLEQHPHANPPHVPSDLVPPPLQVTEGDVM